jgi:hypothetical protein
VLRQILVFLIHQVFPSQTDRGNVYRSGGHTSGQLGHRLAVDRYVFGSQNCGNFAMMNWCNDQPR